MRSRTAGIPSGRFSWLPEFCLRVPREMPHGLGGRSRAPASAPHLLKGALQLGGRIGLVRQCEPDPVCRLSRREPRQHALRPDATFHPPPRVAGFSSLFRCCHHCRQFLFVVPVFHASAFLRPFAPRSLPASPRLRTLCLPPGGSSGAIALNAAWPRRVSLIIAGGLPAIPSPTIGASTGDRPAASGLTPPPTGLASLSKARPSTPTESSSRRTASRPSSVTDWSFSFRGSPPRIAATQLRFDTARLFAAQERTSTALSSRLLRRTRATGPPAAAKKSFRTWSSRHRTRRCWCWFTEGVHGFHGLTRIKSKKVMAVSDS